MDIQCRWARRPNHSNHTRIQGRGRSGIRECSPVQKSVFASLRRPMQKSCETSIGAIAGARGNLDAILSGQAVSDFTPLSPRRGAGVAEQGCLLSSYSPKGCRGFESPPLRQPSKNHTPKVPAGVTVSRLSINVGALIRRAWANRAISRPR